MSSLPPVSPETISRRKKERFLLTLSEDKFRDEVIRPLLLRQGFQDGRELCGPEETGKDAIFTDVDKLNIRQVYAVQTKKGNLNLASKASNNLITSITQIKTALAAKILFVATHEKVSPSRVILCASGRINDRAKEYIEQECNDSRITFLDCDDIIPRLDEHYPEYWWGIDAQIFPYLRSLKQRIEQASESILVSELVTGKTAPAPATDALFLPLKVYRFVTKQTKARGAIRTEPRIEDFPVQGVLTKKENRILILGEAGSGKSTCLQRLAYILTKRGVESTAPISIPVMLKAVNIATRRQQSLVEICGDETVTLGKLEKPAFNAKDLNEGRVIILIDALDELTDEEGRSYVVKAVDEFHELYPKCKSILTSREYSFLEKIPSLKEYAEYRISPIDYKQAGQLLERLQSGKPIPMETTKEVMRQLEEVHGMDLNPLLVTVFYATNEFARHDIPSNITELFKKFTEMMLGRWDAHKGLAQQFHFGLKDHLLKRIAFELHRRRATAMSLLEVQLIMERDLISRGHAADTKQIVDEAIYRSGLFLLKGEQVEFRHLMLQEFFAGRGIPSVEFLQTVIADDWWRRAIVFFYGENAGDLRGVEKIVEILADRPVEDIYRAAITVGLALQACYLAKMQEKVSLYRWVIEGLAQGRVLFEASSKSPLATYLNYYFYARDSVAAKLVLANADEIHKPWDQDNTSQEERDVRMFWLIIGLIEAGLLNRAEKFVRRFRPSDTRLLLAIHLSSYLVKQIRVASSDNKHAADRICNRLTEPIAHLKQQLLAEFKSELLEWRKGRVRAIEAPREAQKADAIDTKHRTTDIKDVTK